MERLNSSGFDVRRWSNEGVWFEGREDCFVVWVSLTQKAQSSRGGNKLFVLKGALHSKKATTMAKAAALQKEIINLCLCLLDL